MSNITILTTTLLMLAVCSFAFDYIEDFDDGVADGFIESGAAWWISDGVYSTHVEGYAFFSLATLGDMSWQDYRIECDVMVKGSVNHVVHVRGDQLHNTYSLNLRSAPFNDIIIARRYNDNVVVHASSPYACENETWHHLRITVLGGFIEVVVDNAASVSFHDPSPIPAGPFALIGFSGGAHEYQDAQFDNVSIDFLSIENEDLSVRNLKQYYR